MVKYKTFADGPETSKKESLKPIEKSQISNEKKLTDIKPIEIVENPKTENFENFEPGQDEKKSKEKSIKIELNDNDIKIDNDDIRTSFRLIVKKTNRDNTKETVKAIKEFLDTHEVLEYSKSRYVFRAI
jgi:hypothetical protein